MPAVPEAPPNSGKAASPATVPFTHGLTGVNISLDDKVTYALWISVAIIFLVVLLGRLGQLANGHIRLLLSVRENPTSVKYWETDKTSIWPWIKKHIIYSPLHKKRHNQEIMLSRAISVGTLPSRLHTAILVMYLVSNAVYCLVLSYHDKPQAAVLAELRGRTGHLAMVNMVPLIVLAGRNNPLIHLLHVSFDTYNLFHRWIGRLVVVQAVVHTIAWAANVHTAQGSGAVSQAIAKSPFLGYGLVGTIAMVMILLQSPSVVRHAFYETFLHCHQILALASIIGVWVHCDLGKLPGKSYIRATLILWILDRLVRIVRIVYRNVGRNGLSKVTVESIPGDGSNPACRVSFQLARPWKFTPGSHAYIYLPRVSFWMNHPFSIAWSDSRPTPYLSLEKEFLPDSDSELDIPKPERTTTEIHFVIAKRTGMTAKLYDLAASSPTGVISLSGIVEGPYGGNDCLHSYGTVILFAAGVGITHQIGHVRELLQGAANGTTATRKIVLVWTVKNTETLEWVRPFMDECLCMPNRKQVLKIMMFVTRPRSKREVSSRSETVLMFPGRCDPALILRKEVRDRQGAMAVTVCGPGAFADDVRAAVRSKGVMDVGTVDFVEESFTW